MGGNGLGPGYWSSRYSNNQTGWDLGAVSTPLKAYIDQLSDKSISILIPGAGNAYEAEYLFNSGLHNVFICDLAAEPLHNFLKRCPGFDKSHLLQHDFFELKNKAFDLIIEQTFFCALQPALSPAYAVKMHALLRPGGKLVGLLFNDALNPDQPPFGGSTTEYLGYFEPLFYLKVFEPCSNSIKPRLGRELFINLVKAPVS